MLLSQTLLPVRRSRLQVALGALALVCGACLPPTVPDMDDPESFCSRSGMFYCNSYSVPQMLQEHGWAGSCAVPAYDFPGIVGYVGATPNGGQSPAYPTLDAARREACGNPQADLCISVVQCKRQ